MLVHGLIWWAFEAKLRMEMESRSNPEGKTMEKWKATPKGNIPTPREGSGPGPWGEGRGRGKEGRCVGKVSSGFRKRVRLN